MKNLLFAEELREAINSGQERDFTNVSFRSNALTGQGTDIEVKSVSEIIVQDAAESSGLIAAVNIIPIKTTKGNVPVQKDSIGKFVPMERFETYTEVELNYDCEELESKKFGLAVKVSDESLDDSAADLEADVKRQLTESYIETVEELIVKGNKEKGIDGLNSISEADGAVRVAQAQAGTITQEDIEAIYKALAKKYRKGAKWVMSDEMALQIGNLKDSKGNYIYPTMQGDNLTLLNKPVIVSVDCADGTATGDKAIFFGDLKRALVFGPRKGLTIKKSKTPYFVEDITLLKATTILDIKKALCKAIVYFETV